MVHFDGNNKLEVPRLGSIELRCQQLNENVKIGHHCCRQTGFVCLANNQCSTTVKWISMSADWPKCWWNGWLRCQQQIGKVKIGNQWCRHAGSVCLLIQQLIHRWRRSRLRGWLSGWLNNLLNGLFNNGLTGRLNQKRYSRARNLICSFRT